MSDSGRVIPVLLLCLAILPATTTLPAEPDSDDRLTNEEDRLVAGLTRRAMPELVDELLAGRSGSLRAHVARAYARAAGDTKEPGQRDRFVQRAEQEYRSVLALRNDRRWLVGEEHRLLVAEWWVELADLLLRSKAAPDLDRFEATSGLDFDRSRLPDLLGSAHQAYESARPLVEDLLIGLRTQEERFLLLGIADRVSRLAEQRRLGGSWAALYLAMLTPPQSPRRGALLAEALAGFDAAARSGKDSARKYHSLVGAGISLREAGRHDEAVAALDRVIASTASRGLVARAIHEKARCQIAARHFERARITLKSLEDLKKSASINGDAVFYCRLAPLLRALALITQARTAPDPVKARALTDNAMTILDTAAREDPGLARIVEAYRGAAVQGTTKQEDMSEGQLRALASRHMGESRFQDALSCLAELSRREGGRVLRVEDRFNRAVCWFQLDDLSKSAAEFGAITEMTPVPKELVERAMEYAYRSASQLSLRSRSPENFRVLAAAAARLSERMPKHERATQARWVAALALQDAGNLHEAIAAYGTIAAGSPFYWQARRNRALCTQRSHESMKSDASSVDRARAAREAVTAWLAFAVELAKCRTSLPVEGKKDGDSVEMANGAKRVRSVAAETTAPPSMSWIEDARIAAAALLIHDDLRAFREALNLLEKMPPSGRVLGLKIQCHRGLGDMASARSTLKEFLKSAPDEDRGSVLGGMVAELEGRVASLRALGRMKEADVLSAEIAPMLRELLDWTLTQPHHMQHAPVVRLSLVRALRQAGDRGRAIAEVEALMRDDPRNGPYLFTAAQLYEEEAQLLSSAGASTADRRAAELWAKLLEDASLRDKAPEKYWEARYRWLQRELRAGRAREVLRGIEAERAWYPELGGEGWQVKYLELADRARERDNGSSP